MLFFLKESGSVYNRVSAGTEVRRKSNEKPKVQEKYNIFTSELIFHKHREVKWYEVLVEKVASVPLYFLQFLAQGKLDIKLYSQIVEQVISTFVLLPKNLYNVLLVTYGCVSC